MVDLFPTAVLDNSILTSVLLGLLITWVFQETFGWNFTGLVVPGYLASVFVIQPDTGGLIVVEAGLTYALVYLGSEITPPHWINSRLFGRDRFFALLLASVTIRLVVEGIGLDVLSQALGRPLSPTLHSMGLLVMPLAANALWRTGMARGLLRLGVPIALTWLLLHILLLPYTNLSLASFELTYEDLALDFVTSPKAYMLLLAGSWLGSVSNREYGFDFGGIIVPGLLAVCWMFPTRVLTTLTEAIAVWAVLAVLIRLPGLRRANLAGGRLLVLGFVVMYALKFSLGWMVGLGWPGARIHDLFGFGYLLPTLMGLRMHKHGQPFRFLVPTLGISFMAFLGASTLGFLLAIVLPPSKAPPRVIEDREAIFAAYANQGAVPTTQRMRESVAGGDGFGMLLRREGTGPALVARVGSAGLAQTTLALADRIDARAVLLCASDALGCRAGIRTLDNEGAVWHVEASRGGSVLRAYGDDLRAVDLDALGEVLPGLALQTGPKPTRLVVDPLVLTPQPHPHPTLPALVADENAPLLDLGRLRAFRDELAPPLARFVAGEEGATRQAARAAALFEWQAHHDADTLWMSSAHTQVQVRRNSTPRVVLVRDAQNPGIVPLAHAMARTLNARALIVETKPAIQLSKDASRTASHAVLTGLLAAWPDAEVLELRGLRDTYDIGSSWGWSTPDGVTKPAVVAELESLTSEVFTPYDSGLRTEVLDAGSLPGRGIRPPGRHTLLSVDTRVRHRFIPPPDVAGLATHPAVFGPQGPVPEWGASWIDRVRGVRTARQATGLQTRLTRSGITLSARCTRVGHCEWLVLERCDETCESVWVPRYPGLDATGLNRDAWGQP